MKTIFVWAYENLVIDYNCREMMALQENKFLLQTLET